MGLKHSLLQWFVFILVFPLGFLSCGSSAPGPDVYADMILTGGQVVTVDEKFSVAEAIAVRNGRIESVGSAAEVIAFKGPDTQVVDITGKTVIPGIQDSHIHFLGLGRDVRHQAELTFARDAEDIVQAVAELKERLDPEPGEWLIGNRWDQYKYPQMVTRWQLDEAAPENPVLLNRVYRGVAVNTEVFRLMGIDDGQPSTWPDWWLKDPSNLTFEDKIYREPRTLTIDGEAREYEIPTGVFVGARASRLVTARPEARNPEEAFEADVESVRDGAREMLSLGVTSVVDPSSRMGYNMRVYQEAYNRGWLEGLRISAVYEGTFTTEDPDKIRSHMNALKINNLGDSRLRWRGAKFYSDGGAGTRSAWLSDTFTRWQDFEGEKNTGYPVVEDDAFREAQYRAAAVEYGWDLHTHTCGDKAMRQAADLYIKLMNEIKEKKPDADLRWSLIHAYLPMEAETRLLEDMAEHGIIASCNPVFQWQEGISFSTNLGEKRMARTQPFRSYVEAGVLLTSGSDYPVTSHNPWIGMYALLTREAQATGKVFGPEETLNIEDALRTYTINGARLTYEEDFKGTLEKGKTADLAVLDIPDIHKLEEDPSLLFEMRDRILLTLTEGKIRFQKENFEFF